VGRWDVIRGVRRVVTGGLELERQAKTIGASLEAAPVVHVPPNVAGMLDAERFADTCIVSQITITTDPVPERAFTLPDVPGVGMVFARAEGEKCQRCWKILPDVGTHAHPGTCARCNAALGG
jgi:isoleucyl-tRNA synthetase